jgi:acetyl esterase/lipase
MKRLGFLLCLVLFLAALPAPAEQDKQQPPAIQKDIVFGKGGDQDLQLNLAMPKGDGPFPTIVCVHGGGWKAGHRNDLNLLVAYFAEKGFVAATVSYRFAPKYKFPAQIEDCKAAVRWLRANAKEYKINPDKIGAVGFSAGGHLVSLLGAANEKSGLEGTGGNPKQSSKVQAVVNFFGPTDFITKTWNKDTEEKYFIGFLGGTFDEARDMYKKASPLNYVSKDNPPFLFIHGDKDTLVDIHHSKVMDAKLREMSVSSKLVVMEGHGHGWAGEALFKSLDQTNKFFEEKLKK